MKPQPLPCPFCGKMPAIDPVDPERMGNAWGEVLCVNQRCVTYDSARGSGVHVRDGATIAGERGPDKYKEAAIRRWNKRSRRR